MKASELMQGDYITFKDSIETDKTPLPVKVIGIGYVGRGIENEALVEINGDETCDIIEIDDECVGIPITEKILEKNFEKKTFYGIYDDYFDIDIREYSDGLYIVTYHSCEFNIQDQTIHLSWVHELQHFMKHCGIDKTIEL